MADQVLQSPTNPHFFKPLLPGFDSQLDIPLAFFSKHVQGRNKHKTARLRSDASDTTWEVKIDGRRLTVGWKEFVTAHDLRIGDIIVFTHQGDMKFHVTCFGPSFCEIQYGQDKITKLARNKDVKKRIPEAETDSCFVAHVTESNLRVDTLFLPRKFVSSDVLNTGSNKIVLMNEGFRTTWTLTLNFRESSRSFYMSSGWRSFCHENGLEPGCSITFKLERNNTITPLLCFSGPESKGVSTKICRKRKRKNTGESSQRFVTLTATPATFKSSRLYLPMSFTRVIKGMENAGGKKINMLDKHGVEWPVNLTMEKGNTVMRLGSGLTNFLKANDMKAHESFVLELVWEDKTSPLMLKLCSKIKT